MKSTLVHPWMIDPRDGLPLRSLGVRKDGRAIWPIMGAAEDEDDDDDDGVTGDDAGKGGDEDDEDDGDEDPWAGKSEAELKTELAKLKAAGDRTRREAEAWRKKATGKVAPPPKPKTAPVPANKNGTFTKEELDAQREEAREDGRSGLMPTLIRTAAEGRLERAGLSLPEDGDAREAKLTRVIKLIDTDTVEVDDNGRLIGLDDAVDALKADYPELFKGKARAPRPGNTSGGKGTGGKPKTATELQMEHAFGRS